VFGLSSRTLLMLGGAVAIVVIALSFWLYSGRGGCSSRADIEARVQALAGEAQQAASQGKINVEELASRIKRMNEAASAYETSKDAQAYCEALGKLQAEFGAE
jgi:hypothetical protein